MILHLVRMRRNVNRNVFNDRKNVSATTPLQPADFLVHTSLVFGKALTKPERTNYCNIHKVIIPKLRKSRSCFFTCCVNFLHDIKTCNKQVESKVYPPSTFYLAFHPKRFRAREANTAFIGPVSGSRYMARLHATGADWGLDTRIIF